MFVFDESTGTIKGLRDRRDKTVSDLVISSKINGVRVRRIDDYAFNECWFLTSIAIPDSVTYVGKQAFRGCTSLTSIKIPNSVTEIGEDAFRDCTSLTNVTIGNSVMCIGRYAFYNCVSLKSVIIPNSVKTIGNCAFRNCTSLKDVELPENVKLGEKVFETTPVEYLDDTCTDTESYHCRSSNPRRNKYESNSRRRFE